MLSPPALAVTSEALAHEGDGLLKLDDGLLFGCNIFLHKLIGLSMILTLQMLIRLNSSFTVWCQVNTVIWTQRVAYMLQNNIAVPLPSSWDSPSILVPKQDGIPGFCPDLRKVNSVTKSD